MKYNYFCEDNECSLGAYIESDIDGLIVKLTETDKIGEELLVWEESHGMMERPEIKCPICGGKASKYLAFNSGNFYFRGNCYLDKAGCRRQMDLHYLDGKDDEGKPLNTYDEHYESGEKDHIRDTLKRGGKKAPIISKSEQSKQASQAKLDYVQRVLDTIGKAETEVEISW